MRALVWFRSDLRTLDNTALFRACSDADSGAVAAFVISPSEWEGHDVAPCRVDFILRTLGHLTGALARLGIPLIVLEAPRVTDVPRLLLDLAARARCDALYFNREYELDESRRDSAVTREFEQSGRRVLAFDDQVILPPGDVRTAEGTCFSVFTPYKRAWLARWAERKPAPVGTPRPQSESGLHPSPIPTRVEGFSSDIDPDLWPAGEQHARKRLDRFIETRLASYQRDRNSPAADGTSALSPYLAAGAISPRQCLSAALEANRGRMDNGQPGPSTWISELIWREFYVHVAAGFPRVCMGRAFRPETDRIAWRHDGDDFDAWREGRTGYPVVDAGMRQLRRTGWMHNRVRMVAAMFLTKDLFIDWRWGERHFMRHLVDGFFASNNGGWQWSASTGTDAAPYFRIFNPVLQSRQHDPWGDYIRRYVPELLSLDSSAIHDPPPLLRASLGYPEPIVPHAIARDRVLGAFQAVRM